MTVRTLAIVMSLSALLASPAVGQHAKLAMAKTSHTVKANSGRTLLLVPPGRSRVYIDETHQSFSGAEELEVSVHAQLLQADNAERHDGKLMLTVVSELNGPSKSTDGFMLQQPRFVLRLPLSSVAEAYGESRTCTVSREGGVTFTFTAGLDEKNFIDFASGADREFRFSLNKYLCRALAAPFQCTGFSSGSVMRDFPSDTARWKVGTASSVELQSVRALARAQVSAVTVHSSGNPFNYAACSRIAPSNGICCVSHIKTEWHCGGAPAGEGWHQVSGDCFHRETGSACTE